MEYFATHSVHPDRGARRNDDLSVLFHFVPSLLLPVTV